jgi:glycosyltransferase involved in cell wall biosynthesis
MSEAPAARFATTERDAITRSPNEIRWLFVDAARTFGGHEVMLLRWLEELASQRSVTTFLLARESSPLHREATQHTTVLSLAEQRRPSKLGRIMNEISDAIGFARQALAVKPDVCILAEGCLLTQPLFAFVARLLGLKVLEYVPLVQTSTSMGFGSGRIRDAFVRQIYGRLLHGWITITREQADDFRAWAKIRGPIFTLPNTVGRAIEAAAGLGGTAERAPARLRIVVLGRIEAHQKGLDVLLDFLTAQPELATRFELTFVGRGPFEPVIAARLTSDARLAKWVSMQPWSPTLHALRSHDVLLLTSRYEGVPLVMLEAMALGVPVVAPDLEGTGAFLAAQSLFPKGDMDAAFRCVEQLLDPETRQLIARRNHAQFERLASGAAFSTAVKALTQQIRALVDSKVTAPEMRSA